MSYSSQFKSRVVTFSYGTVKDASLRVPVGPYNLVAIADMARESYLDYAFRPGCCLMSDECVTSSIGHSNFMAGVLGGYETRLDADTFAHLKAMLTCDMSMAVAVARYRNPNGTQCDHYTRASENEVLNESTRAFLVTMSKTVAA